MNTPGLSNQEMKDESRAKLLLADDSVTIRRVVELTFADEGIDVTSAADAASAMEKFVEIQPDIVLVDVGLSGTSGYQICEMIKQDEATRHIPVLLLVGSFEPFDQDLAERAGADGFLTKPFQSIRELVSRVSELLSPSTQSDENSVAEIVEAGPAEEGNLPEGEDGSVDDEPGEEPPPEVADIENLYQSSFAETETKEFDTAHDPLGDTGLDDELIEASYQTLENIESVNPDEKRSREAAEVKDFSWSVTDTNDIGVDNAAEKLPAREDEAAFDETLSDYDPSSGENGVIESKDIASRAAPIEPSPEFIALVAERVIERLSDRAVRDIAKEAVPRIAEKLIREALAEERKS